MLQHLKLLRRIGQFESVAEGGQLELKRLALIYAENGRGKTTISCILRSLRSGNAEYIEERARLGAAQPPHVVLQLAAPHNTVIYQDRTWTKTVPGIAIYDDVFVDENVCSGLSIESSHRQNLNEVILGEQGVSLNRSLQQRVQEIETHNRNLRARADVYERIKAMQRPDLPPKKKPLSENERFDGLQTEIDRLRSLVDRFDDRFARIAYHCAARGIDLEQLQMPLPILNREKPRVVRRKTSGRR